MVTGGNLTWGGNTIQCTGDMLWNGAPETRIILSASVIPMNSINRGKKKLYVNLGQLSF